MQDNKFKDNKISLVIKFGDFHLWLHMCENNSRCKEVYFCDGIYIMNTNS